GRAERRRGERGGAGGPRGGARDRYRGSDRVGNRDAGGDPGRPAVVGRPQEEPHLTAPEPTGGGRQAAQVAAGIMLSRVLGYVRQRAIAYYIGNGWAADALSVAQRVPNIIRSLLAEGTLSASFIPVYAALNARPDKGAARALAGAILGLLWGTVAGSVLQVAIQLPACWRVLHGIPVRWSRSTEGVRDVLVAWLPVVLGAGVAQISGLIDTLLGTLAGEGGASSLQYAQ